MPLAALCGEVVSMFMFPMTHRLVSPVTNDERLIHANESSLRTAILPWNH